MHRAALFLGTLTPGGCQPPPMTAAEVGEAFGYTVETSRIDVMTDDIMVVSTDFTLGQGAADVAESMRSWWASQAQCAEVTAAVRIVTVDFGDLADDCTWNGHIYGGVVTIELAEVGEEQAVVEHTWTPFTNGGGILDGVATVTWSAAEQCRRVQVDATWTGVEHTLELMSDRTLRRLDPDSGPGTSIVVDGLREVAVDGGDVWLLEIQGVELRAQDPAPQAGRYRLTAPSAREASLVFERLDASTIEVRTEGLRRDRSWHVTALGASEV